MAVAVVAFTSGLDTSNSASGCVTASKTWQTGHKYRFTIFTRFAAGTACTPAVANATQRGTTQLTATLHAGLSVFDWIGDGSTGTVAITVGGVAQDHIQWAVDDITGGTQTGTNGADGVVQLVQDNQNNTTATVTLAAFGSGSNATWFCACDTAGGGLTIKAGYTATATDTQYTHIKNEYQATSDTTPNMTLGSAEWMAFGIEEQVAGGGGSSVGGRRTRGELGTRVGARQAA